MGWDYEERTMYGFYMKTNNKRSIESFLNKNDKLVKDDYLSDSHNIFIYVKSTYEILDNDHGSYSRRLPDYECHTEININKMSPILSKEEQDSLDDFCSTYNKMIELIWIESSYYAY